MIMLDVSENINLKKFNDSSNNTIIFDVIDIPNVTYWEK